MSKTTLFVSHDASRTGAPLFLLRFLNWLRENHDIQFRTLLGCEGKLRPDFEALGTVDTFEPPAVAYRVLRRLSLHGRSLRAHRWRLREELLRDDFSLIYANSVASAEMVGFLSFLKCPVICHVHEAEGSIRALGSHIMPTLKERVALYITPSCEVKINLAERHKIPIEKIRVVENFITVRNVSEAYYEQSRTSIRKELGISGEAKIVCACGATEPRKGTDLFLQVAARIRHEFSARLVHFVWVGGGGAARTAYVREAASLGLANTVHFIGERTNVADYFAASDVFLLTSREEAFPLVMLEAAFERKPIICFDNSGAAPAFIGSELGFVVPDLDTHRMSERLMELLSSAKLSSRMGMAGRKKVLENHAMNVGAARIASIIQHLV